MSWWLLGMSIYILILALIWAFFIGASGGQAPVIKIRNRRYPELTSKLKTKGEL
jgi:hypothetical protein